MNETMARSLTDKELAEQFRYHADPGIARLAKSLIDYDIGNTEASQALIEAEREAEAARSDADEAEVRANDMVELLRECLSEIPPGNLRDRISLVLK